MNRNNQQSGFTIVELMLAMAFVSALLLAIAMTIIQIGNIYNHGVTLKSVNQSGSVISRELQRSISGSSPFDVDVGDDGVGDGSNYVKKDWGGRLCTGQYSYIWNYGATINSSKDPLNPNRNVYLSDDKDIHFVKIYDPSLTYCTRDVETNAYPPIQSSAVELLNSDQTELAIHSFDISVEPSAYDAATGQRLYSIKFFIGTNDQSALEVDATSNETSCLLPGNPNSDPFFCSVVRFDITARAGNVNDSN